MSKLTSIASQFYINGKFIEAVPFGTGHIHETFLANFTTPAGTKHYVLQRINQHVFKEPRKVMQNIERITHHTRERIIERGGNPARECLNIVPSREGEPYIIHTDGSYWRVFDHIEGTNTYDAPEHPKQIFETAKAFGIYQKDLSDLPGERLHETIPNFHNTPLRFETMVKTIKSDPFNRAIESKEEIAFILRREPDTRVISDKLARGEIPERVNHNDAKLNNVLLDEITGKGVCVIDLDTTMPGTPLFDFGDMVRTGVSIAPEDESDVSKVKVNLELFCQIAGGYLDEARSFLTPTEVQLLAFAGKTITLEQGIRFLTDYLAGDTYYRIHFPAHNLVRARAQLALVADIELKMDNLDEIIYQGQSGGAHG